MLNKHNLKGWPLLIGFLIWFAILSVELPYSIFDINHVEILLLAAPLWLIPMSLQIIKIDPIVQRLVLPIVILFSVSFLLNEKMLSAALVVPWLLLTSRYALKQFYVWREKSKRKISDHSQLAAFLYLPVGVAWAFADRLGIEPMGFSPTITLLTAVHFHYAGFLLPLLVALLFDKKTQIKKWESFSAWGVIFGVPLTALGITTTQFYLPSMIEVFCVTLMAGSALLMGLIYLRWAWSQSKMIFRVLWLLCGLALIGGMLLALGYGWRTVFFIPQLTIPWMYAIHGTLNAIGFALPGVLAWWLYHKQNNELA